MRQDGLSLPWVMVAVVQEENNFTAELLPQPAGRDDLGVEKPLGEESARLLAETDDGVIHGLVTFKAGVLPPPAAC